MSILHWTTTEVTWLYEWIVVIVLSSPPAVVWADLPFNEEGHPDQEQIDAWKHFEYQQKVDEWLSENE
jgi:hypothetical protein